MSRQRDFLISTIRGLIQTTQTMEMSCLLEHHSRVDEMVSLILVVNCRPAKKLLEMSLRRTSLLPRASYPAESLLEMNPLRTSLLANYPEYYLQARA